MAEGNGGSMHFVGNMTLLDFLWISTSFGSR
jgi:hypothetical protein